MAKPLLSQIQRVQRNSDRSTIRSTNPPYIEMICGSISSISEHDNADTYDINGDISKIIADIGLENDFESYINDLTASVGSDLVVAI